MDEICKTETDIFNSFRSLLSSSDIEVLQLVPPGGQAPLSLTYTPATALRRKTIYPDFLGYDASTVYLGEMKPRYSKQDYTKLEDLRNSPDAYVNLVKLVERIGRRSLGTKPEILPLLIHAQKDANIAANVTQFVFITKTKVLKINSCERRIIQISDTMQLITDLH